GEDVLEEAANELLSGEGTVLELVSGRLFVSESDSAIMKLAQAVVGDSDAKDVRSEILKGLSARADGLRVDHPGFAPDALLDLSEESGLFQLLTKLGAE